MHKVKEWLKREDFISSSSSLRSKSVADCPYLQQGCHKMEALSGTVITDILFWDVIMVIPTL